ncbi:MAG: hypothetical protein LBG95_04560 [Treponema sp.]|jgi:hypothetical protein|nr:hypothetical protein [Treponema sp.]
MKANIKLKLYLLFVICYLLSAASLSALGKKDEAEQTPQNDQWLLCVTAFDYSGLPSNRHIAGEVLVRTLVSKLGEVNYRLRLSPEYAYYESYARQEALSTTAKSLSNKHIERSQLLYRGDPDWKYRANLKKIDADIVKLEEDYRLKEAAQPLIESEPVFGLIQANVNGTFPDPPQKGGERRFCQNQKADAFLTGQIREFHDRYYIHLRLFTLYTNSWVYEDDIIFSLEDAEGSVEEIAARLKAVLSGNKPSSVAVRVDPPEAQILINQGYAGRGTSEARERPPGRITIAVAADEYAPIIVETELAPGELTEVGVVLSPLYYSEVNINVTSSDWDSPKQKSPDTENLAAVYHGALYVGEAPYTLRLPIGRLAYVTVENRNGETAQGVFISPGISGESSGVNLKTKAPYPSGQRRVNRARSEYYWAWAGTWLTGLAAWITYGIYSSQLDALSKSYDLAFYFKTERMYYISTGAIIVVGAAVANEIFWMARYIKTSTDSAVPIVRKERVKRK